MTDVVYDRKEHRLTVSGHAGGGEVGSDPICAAVSILAYTFAQACIDAVEFKFAKRDSAYTKFEDGYAEVSVKPHKKYDDMVAAILDSICNGYVLLAAKYKDNVRFNVK